jgi:hypothetical protein
MTKDELTYARLERFFEDIKIYQAKKLSLFFRDYTQIVGQQKEVFLNTLAKNLPELIGGLIPKRQEFIEKNRYCAFDYNIFTIIGRSRAYPQGYSRLETITHSPFLKELLDPRGAHGQKDLFYREFIASLQGLKDEKRKKFQNCIPEYLIAACEENNIDILLRSLKPDNPIGLIFENKINNAQDQERQLQKYYEDVKSSWGFNDEQIIIIYFTPNGRNPSDRSLNEKERLRLLEKNVLFCVSAKNIAEWLEKSLKGCESGKVQVILSQYLDVIRRIADG